MANIGTRYGEEYSPSKNKILYLDKLNFVVLVQIRHNVKAI
jgi:hypothetical protein